MYNISRENYNMMIFMILYIEIYIFLEMNENDKTNFNCKKCLPMHIARTGDLILVIIILPNTRSSVILRSFTVYKTLSNWGFVMNSQMKATNSKMDYHYRKGDKTSPRLRGKVCHHAEHSEKYLNSYILRKVHQ